MLELTKRHYSIEDWVVFSRSHYIAGEVNDDFSPNRVDRVSAIRLAEEEKFADSLGGITVVPLGQNEAKLRGHSDYTALEKTFSFNDADNQVIDFLASKLRKFFLSDYDIFIPLAVGGHIDHLVVRAVALKLIEELGSTIMATLFFYEDLPYSAETKKVGWRPIKKIIKKLRLRKIILPIDLPSKLKLIDFYPSQHDPAYYDGVATRALTARRLFIRSSPGEIIYQLTKIKDADLRLPFNRDAHDFTFGYWRQDLYYWLNYCYQWRSLPYTVLDYFFKSLHFKKIEKISIVIATKNRLEALKEYSLPSLAKQVLPPGISYELIIVDASDDDSTYNYLKSLNYWSKLIYLRVGKNSGVSVSRNLGVSQASGEVVAFIDDDCSVDQQWLDRMAKIFSDPSILVSQGQIYDLYFKKNIINPSPSYPEQVYFAGNLAARRDLFALVTFNEQMSFFGEDWELIMRLQWLWPFGGYYFDHVAISHYRSPSPYRISSNESGLSDLNRLGKKIDGKMTGLWFVSRCVVRRNSNINALGFGARFWIKEIFWSPIELILVRGDFRLLLKTKFFLLSWLKGLKK